MSKLRIKVTQDLTALNGKTLNPLVKQILGGRRDTNLNSSVLKAACEDIKYMLDMVARDRYEYECTDEGHFFLVDEEVFSKPGFINIFTICFSTKIETSNVD